MRVRFYHEIKDSRARIAEMVSLFERLKDRVTGIVGGESNVFGKGLSSLVELEFCEEMEGETFASEIEERAVSSPVDEL